MWWKKAEVSSRHKRTLTASLLQWGESFTERIDNRQTRSIYPLSCPDRPFSTIQGLIWPITITSKMLHPPLMTPSENPPNLESEMYVLAPHFLRPADLIQFSLRSQGNHCSLSLLLAALDVGRVVLLRKAVRHMRCPCTHAVSSPQTERANLLVGLVVPLTTYAILHPSLQTN